MNCKLAPSTMSVILVRTIKTLCEINVEFSERLEISGSIHIRADGAKILTCLLDEETIKQENDMEALSSGRIAELAARLSLANSSFNYQIPNLVPQSSNATLDNNLGGAGLVDLTSYLLSPNTQRLLQQQIEQQQQQLQQQLEQQQGHQEQLQQLNEQLNQKLQQSAAVQQFSQLLDKVSSEQNKSDMKPYDNINSMADSINSMADSMNCQQPQTSSSYSTESLSHITASLLQVKSTPRRSGRSRRKTNTIAGALNSSAENNMLHHLSSTSMLNESSTSSAIKLPDIETLAQQLPGFLSKDKYNMNSSTLDNSLMGNVRVSQNESRQQSTSDVIDRLLVSMPSYASNSNEAYYSGGTLNGTKSSNDALQSDADSLLQISTGASVGSKKYQCLFCGIFLSTKCYLKNHVNAMHTRTRVYNCEHCTHRFYSAGALRIHRLRNHWIGARKHRCALCEESFLLPIELRKHLQKKHPDCGSGCETERVERKSARVTSLSYVSQFADGGEAHNSAEVNDFDLGDERKKDSSDRIEDSDEESGVGGSWRIDDCNER